MFDKQYRFKGKHAKYVDRLTAKFDETGKIQLFRRNIDVLTNAPLVGFLYGERADLDNERDPVTNQVYDENIMTDRLLASSNELHFDFALIMLLDEEYEPDPDKRIKKAFGEPETQAADEERFNQYIRGGVEVLYEKLINGASTQDDYMNNLFDFLNEFNGRFQSVVSQESIVKIARDLQVNN
jgi:hypothetical protein